MYKILKVEDCTNSSPVVIEKPQIKRTIEKKDIDTNDNSIPLSIIKNHLKNIQTIQDRIIKNAKNEADKLLKETKKLINELKENAKKTGYNEGYSNGYEEGLKKGIAEGKEKTSSLIAEAREIKNEILNERKNLQKEFECDMISTIIECVKKIIDINIEENSDIIINLIKKGLENYEASDIVTVKVSESDYEYLVKNKDKVLRSLRLIDDINIVKDISLNKGDCIIHTPSGMIDSGLKTQLENLEKALKGVLNEQ